MKTKFPYKNALKIISILLLFSVLSFQRITAQIQLLDSLTLDTLKAYTSIEEALKNPELVVKLELRKKKLKTFPAEILKFINLQYLDLSKNSIKEIPDEIAQLKSLQYLAISKNDLEELTPKIGGLVNLYYLNLNQNELTSLPMEIGKLENLKNLDLWSNNIDKYPTELKNLKNLQVMDLRVIMIPDAEQERVQSLLPHTKIYFSPFCKCQQ